MTNLEGKLLSVTILSVNERRAITSALREVWECLPYGGTVEGIDTYHWYERLIDKLEMQTVAVVKEAQ